MTRILVADDNSNIQRMVALVLRDIGAEVIAVGNGESAVRKMPELNPDLVLADIFMPVRNGYEVCEFVKHDSRFAHIPVVLLVGAFDPLDALEAQRVKADGVLKKPFVPPDPLLNMVKALLVKSAGERLVAVAVPAAAQHESGHVVAPQSVPGEAVDELTETPPTESGLPHVEANGQEKPASFSSLLAWPVADVDADAETTVTAKRDPNLGEPAFWIPPAETEDNSEEDSPTEHDWRAHADAPSSRAEAVLSMSPLIGAPAYSPLVPLNDESEPPVEPEHLPVAAESGMEDAPVGGMEHEAEPQTEPWAALQVPEEPDLTRDQDFWVGQTLSLPASHEQSNGSATPIALEPPVMSEAAPTSEEPVASEAAPVDLRQPADEIPFALEPPPDTLAAQTPEPEEEPESEPQPESVASASLFADDAAPGPAPVLADVAAILAAMTAMPAPERQLAAGEPERPPIDWPLPAAAETISAVVPVASMERAPLDPREIEAVVNRVIDRMQPRIMEMVTREILRPVVEALVEREIKRR